MQVLSDEQERAWYDDHRDDILGGEANNTSEFYRAWKEGGRGADEGRSDGGGHELLQLYARWREAQQADYSYHARTYHCPDYEVLHDERMGQL